MSYTIISARWTDVGRTSATAMTAEAGEVAINQDRPDLWDELMAWGEPQPFRDDSIISSISPRQARLALLNAGLLDKVENAIKAGPRSVQIEWEFGLEVRRDHQMVAHMQASLGMTSEQVDALFRSASEL